MPIPKKKTDDHVGRQLCSFRKSLGLSQEQLALKLGWEAETVGQIENGERHVTANDLWDLCTFLDVSPSAFFKGIE